MGAFGQLKANAATKEAMPLLNKAEVLKDAAEVELGKTFIAAATKRFFEREPSFRNLA